MWESRKSPGLSLKPRFNNRGFFISNLMLPSSVADLVRRYPAIPDPKSRELILMLLASTADPFSRHQFHPGHITCTGLVLPHTPPPPRPHPLPPLRPRPRGPRPPLAPPHAF